MRYVLLHTSDQKYYIARHANEVIHAEVSEPIVPKENMKPSDFTDVKFVGPNPWVLLNSQELRSYDEKTGTFDNIDLTENALPMPDYAAEQKEGEAPSDENPSEEQKRAEAEAEKARKAAERRANSNS